ncbi:hypothetical protein FHETE_2540 [Fusarium heterosporum]|uniref:Infection structure specific protein n=1 Tax=Fusarium heterosporum TaxID=42747 RepID=A0A8H5WZ40_FUSHE|nr:hypothetical protein FHETE_2540 [Fusarium heterosporum]
MNIFQAIIIAALGTLQAAAQTPTPTSIPTATFSRPSLTTPSCWALKDSLSITGAPAPPMEMSELGVSFALGSLYNTQDPCQLPAVTGKSAEDFSEWASSWTSWQAQHVSEYRVVWEACSDDPAITDLVPVGPDACSTLRAHITGTVAPKNDDKDKNESEGQGDDEPGSVVESSSSRTAGSMVVTLVTAGVLITRFW